MPLSATDKQLAERIENDFTYHLPSRDQAEAHDRMRKLAKQFAQSIIETCADGRERSLAITKLEEATFWIHASIARTLKLE